MSFEICYFTYDKFATFKFSLLFDIHKRFNYWPVIIGVYSNEFQSKSSLIFESVKVM